MSTSPTLSEMEFPTYDLPSPPLAPPAPPAPLAPPPPAFPVKEAPIIGNSNQALTLKEGISVATQAHHILKDAAYEGPSAVSPLLEVTVSTDEDAEIGDISLESTGGMKTVADYHQSQGGQTANANLAPKQTGTFATDAITVKEEVKKKGKDQEITKSSSKSNFKSKSKSESKPKYCRYLPTVKEEAFIGPFLDSAEETIALIQAQCPSFSRSRGISADQISLQIRFDGGNSAACKNVLFRIMPGCWPDAVTATMHLIFVDGPRTPTVNVEPDVQVKLSALRQENGWIPSEWRRDYSSGFDLDLDLNLGLATDPTVLSSGYVNNEDVQRRQQHSSRGRIGGTRDADEGRDLKWDDLRRGGMLLGDGGRNDCLHSMDLDSDSDIDDASDNSPYGARRDVRDLFDFGPSLAPGLRHVAAGRKSAAPPLPSQQTNERIRSQNAFTFDRHQEPANGRSHSQPRISDDGRQVNVRWDDLKQEGALLGKHDTGIPAGCPVSNSGSNANMMKLITPSSPFAHDTAGSKVYHVIDRVLEGREDRSLLQEWDELKKAGTFLGIRGQSVALSTPSSAQNQTEGLQDAQATNASPFGLEWREMNRIGTLLGIQRNTDVVSTAAQYAQQKGAPQIPAIDQEQGGDDGWDRLKREGVSLGITRI
ncbi:hypothetical protein IAU59_002596 [Kwoniella sp. CBS 9459]